jgi:regulator of protease activity HflC (stomatin/prohibitin superfamily)
MAKRVRWWEIVICVLLFLSACAFYVKGPTNVAFALLLLLLLYLVIRLVMVTCLHAVGGHERLLVSRLGKPAGAKGPGTVWTWPFIDSAVPVDLRERQTDVSGVHCTTRDGATLDADFSFSWKIKAEEVEKVKVVEKLEDAIKRLATTTLQSEIGGLEIDGILEGRVHISEDALGKVQQDAERWGVEVMRLTIGRIDPPWQLQEAYTRQIESYRAQRLATQARVDALRKLDEAARDIKRKPFVMELVALETLSKIGEAQSTKYILPMELAGLVRPLAQSLGAAPGEPEAGSVDGAPGASPQSADASTQAPNGGGEEREAAAGGAPEGPVPTERNEPATQEGQAAASTAAESAGAAREGPPTAGSEREAQPPEAQAQASPDSEGRSVDPAAQRVEPPAAQP